MNIPQFSAPFGVAFIRGVYSAAVVFGITLLTTYSVSSSWSDALVVGGIAGLTTLGARTGVEGVVDQRRADSALGAKV